MTDTIHGFAASATHEMRIHNRNLSLKGKRRRMTPRLNYTQGLQHLTDTADVVAEMVKDGSMIFGYRSGEIVYQLANSELKPATPGECTNDRPPSDGWWNLPPHDMATRCMQTDVDAAAMLLDEFESAGITLELNGLTIVVHCKNIVTKHTNEIVALVNREIDARRTGLVVLLSPQDESGEW